MGAVVTPNPADMTNLTRGRDSDEGFMPTINYCNTVYNTTWVHTDGYLSFGENWWWQGTLASYGGTAVIAPFNGNSTNWDASLSGQMSYGTTLYEGIPSFMATWDRMGDNNATNEFATLNTFQVIIQVISSDLWYLIFNYDSVQWVHSYTNAGFTRVSTPTYKSYYLLPGSSAPLTLRDGQTNALINSHSAGTTVNGRYIYVVRNGVPQDVGAVDPTSVLAPDPLQASSRSFRPVGIYL